MRSLNASCWLFFQISMIMVVVFILIWSPYSNVFIGMENNQFLSFDNFLQISMIMVVVFILIWSSYAYVFVGMVKI